MSDTYNVSSSSREYLPVEMTARVDGVSVEPTSDPVYFAFLPLNQADPAPTDFVPAVWEIKTVPPRTLIAKCLIGPGGAPATLLQKGLYQVFVKVTDNPEAPVKRAPEILRIY